MYKNMTYQQAKRIRSQSISSVLADQLIMGAGYGAAIKQTASAKWNAKVSGIKEKFDPLNIIKFMTGGSRLGPAILGKMLGRSRKDIEYFAGRARPVQYRGPKIPGMSAATSGEGDSGLQTVLSSILSFLQSSHENDMILREKENNLREGQKHEDERRHNDLLKALGGSKSKDTATRIGKPEISGNGLFDGISQTIQDMIDKALKAFGWIKELSPFSSTLMSFLRSGLFGVLRGVFGLAGPLAIGALLAYGAKELTEYVGEKQISTAKNLLERNSNRESLSADDKAKLDKEIQSAGGMKKINQVMETANDVPVAKRDIEPRPDTAGGKNAQRARNWDYKFSATHNPDGTPKQVTDSQTNTSTASPEKPKAPVVTTPTTPTSPAPVSTTPKSAEVSAKTQENMNLGLQAKVVPKTETTTNNSIVNNTKDEKRKISMPSVRNNEETFARLIWDSTRVV
jgi:hypothetical protein